MYLVYSASDSEGVRLYLRPMDETVGQPMEGTENGVGPIFSPDGQWVAFWTDGEFKRISIDGGPPVTLCEISNPPYGASWGRDNTIVFGQYNGGIVKVSADGGGPRAITNLAEGEFSHRFPQILPDGEWLMFTRTKADTIWQRAQVMAQSLKTAERKVLVENGADARYVPTGHLVFARLGILMAVPFNAEQLKTTGGPVGVIGDVKQAVNAGHNFNDTGAAQFSFSAYGSLAYVSGGIFPDTEDQLVWLDRQGMAEPLDAPRAPYVAPRISPDGKRVAFLKWSMKRDIWIHDIARASSTRMPLKEGTFEAPLWTPDGSRITFSESTEETAKGIYWMLADGSGSVERLTTGPSWPHSWLPDGRLLAFVSGEKEDDIWVLNLGDEPRPFLASPAKEQQPTFSPDGRWLAYLSNQSGRNEVYVTPYPGPGPHHQISTHGGNSPAWAPNGRELFYCTSMASDGLRSMMAVAIEAEPNFTAGKPRELFREGFVLCGTINCYDVSPDGQRFLVIRPGAPQREPVTQIHIVLNWFEELKRLVPTN
jgi:serine/threonine-protein kinase